MNEKPTDIRNSAPEHTLLNEIRDLLPRCTLKDRRDIERMLKKLRGARQRDHGRIRKLMERAAASAALVEKRRGSITAVTIDGQLPISTRKDDILETCAQPSRRDRDGGDGFGQDDAAAQDMP